MLGWPRGLASSPPTLATDSAVNLQVLVQVELALLHLSTAAGSTFVFRLRGPRKVISPSSRFNMSSDSYIDIDSFFSLFVLRASEACFGDLVAESMGDWEKESAVWS